MTFQEIQKKVSSRWYIILLFGIVVTLLFYPWANEKSYQASITVGIQLNQSENSLDPVQNRENQLAYVNSFEQMSIYMASRFSSVEIQDQISKFVGTPSVNFSEKKPFYTVTNQGAGFIGLSFSGDTDQSSRKFVEVIQENIYPQIVKEWNSISPKNLKIRPMDKFASTVTEVSKPKQLQILPTLTGLVVGIVLAIIWPNVKLSVDIKSETEPTKI